ncbi:unannotated protein [freshwater metagenome]|uniref:Unannotated protein n=1 Tax=freshwater metagenome TaxID=449393 RepID=A0A6J6IQN5_9ZZZZ
MCAAASTPTRMKPAWLMDEYASMRLTLVCTTAIVEPTKMLRTARTQITGRQSSTRDSSPTIKIRNNAANAATLAADAMYDVTDVGAPSYTSGVQIWNGAAETLKPRPTNMRPIPISNIASEPPTAILSDNALAMPLMFVDAVAPYTRAMPYSKNAEAKPPRMKYLRPDS